MHFHQTRTLWLLAALSVLTACVASNPVYHVGTDTVPTNVRGAMFALPKTRLTLTYVRTTTTFEPGAYTPIVERCSKPWPGSSGTNSFCSQLGLLDIKSFRPSLKQRCDGDTPSKEVRVSLGSFTLATAAVPDDSQIYVVDLRRNWFQSFDMDLETDAFGVIGKGQAKTVERAAEDALSFGARLVSTGRTAPAAVAPPAAAVAPAGAASLGASPDDSALRAAQEALTRLKALLDARAGLLASSDTDSLARNALLLAAQQREINVLTAQFTGSVTVDQDDPKTWPYVPTTVSKEETVLEYARCGSETKGHRLVIRANPACTGCSMALENPPKLYGSDKDKGWPTRIPTLANIQIASCAKDGCKEGDFKTVAETGIAQFGPVVRLPARTGGRSSNISATYSALGSLTKLEVDQEGQAATPIFTALNTALTPSPEQVQPTEIQTLNAQVALIKARQELCKLIYGADAKACLSANPPVTQ